MQLIRSRLLDLKPALILFYLSATGFLCILAVQRYLGMPADPIAGLCFTAFIFGIYTFNKFTDSAEDFANDIHKYAFFHGNPVFLGLAMASVALSAGTLVFLERLNWLHMLLIGTGVAYSVRILPWFDARGGFRVIRIKDVPLVKNLIVAMLWCTSVIAWPLLDGRGPVTPEAGAKLIPLGIGLFLLILNNTVIHDVMDEVGDRMARITTLPVLIGGRRTMAILFGLDLLWTGAMAGLWGTGGLDAGPAAFLAMLACFPAAYGALYISGKASRATADFLSETDLVVFSTGLLLLSAR